MSETKSIALPRIAALMSLPRLTHSTNSFCALEVAAELGIRFERVPGVFWGQCMELAMEKHVDAQDRDYLLAIDNDTAYTVQHVLDLIWLAERYPEVDAIAPMQVKRGNDCSLLAPLKSDGCEFGKDEPVPTAAFAGDITRAAWAHFGLTLIRVSSLADLPHPWFLPIPNAQGRWGDGKTDEDIYFWRKFAAHGKRLYSANRVCVGHGQEVISVPGIDLGAVHVYPNEYKSGKLPENVWR